MSLTAFAIRASLVRMLRGATLAGDNVSDSPLDPVPIAVSAKSPLIHVYSEAETLKTDDERTLLQGERAITITLQMFLPVEENVGLGKAATTAEHNVSFGSVSLPIQTRRGGGQAILDLMYRQVEAAITTGPSLWRALYDDLVCGYRSVAIRPYVIQTDKGVRLAAREVEMICCTQNSPGFGPPADLWERFLSAMDTDAALKPLAPLMRQAVIGDAKLTQPQIDAALLGLSDYEARAVAILPTPPTDIGADPNADPALTDDVSISDALA